MRNYFAPKIYGESLNFRRGGFYIRPFHFLKNCRGLFAPRRKAL